MGSWHAAASLPHTIVIGKHYCIPPLYECDRTGSEQQDLRASRAAAGRLFVVMKEIRQAKIGLRTSVNREGSASSN